MTTAPIVFGIYSYYNNGKTVSYKIPYINSFEITKDSDNITVRAVVKLPKNIYYEFDKPLPAPSVIFDNLTGGKSNSPYFFEPPSEQQLPLGLQVLDQQDLKSIGTAPTGDDIKQLKWVSLDRLTGSLLGINNNASAQLLEKSINGPTTINNLGYYGKAFTFDSAFDYNKATSFTIDSQPLQMKESKVYKFAKSYSQDSFAKVFTVGDLFTIRHGILSDAYDNTNQPGTNFGTKDNLMTDSFYITKVVPTQNEIELYLENWTWKLRQIPCRGTFGFDITLLDFLKTFLFPVILKETYLNAIITRDAEATDTLTNQDTTDQSFSKLTDNLLTNGITKGFYLPVTNFYDILVTLKEKFLLNFVDVNYLSPSVVSCSIGYGYRDMTESSIYDAQVNIVNKNIKTLNYDDYKVLVRVTSNKSLKPGELKAYKAKIKKGTTEAEWKIMEAEYKKKAQVIYGDRGVLGLIQSNNAKLGSQTLQSQGNAESANLINVTKLWIENENLYQYAKTLYRKAKYANEFNTVDVKNITNFGFNGGLYDAITIIDRQDPSITGCYIITSMNYSMSTNDGYTKQLKMGVRIPQSQFDDFLKQIK